MKVTRLPLIAAFSFSVLLILSASVTAAKKDKLAAKEKKATTTQAEAHKSSSSVKAAPRTSATNTGATNLPGTPTGPIDGSNLLPSSPQTGEQINWDVISSGGGPMTSTNFMLDGTIGQTVAGPSSSTNFVLNSGYWQNFGTGPSYVCGDADGDGQVIISDAVYLINYIFAGGPAPDPLVSGDVDCDGVPIISDAVYIVNYIFAGGPAPCAACPQT
jgi:hypothetical protein